MPCSTARPMPELSPTAGEERVEDAFSSISSMPWPVSRHGQDHVAAGLQVVVAQFFRRPTSRRLTSISPARLADGLDRVGAEVHEHLLIWAGSRIMPISPPMVRWKSMVVGMEARSRRQAS